MNTRSFLRVITAFAAGVALSLNASAQIVGLPIMDTADTRAPGQFEIIPGATLGEDMTFIGARASLSLMEELRAFLDIGRLDIADRDENIAIQGGGLYSLPMTDLCDTAIRGAMYYCNTDRMDLIGGNLMLVCSGQTVLSDDLYAYTAFGLDASTHKVHSSHSELNPAIAAGLTLKMTDRISLFAEGDFVDGLYVAGGLSFR